MWKLLFFLLYSFTARANNSISKTDEIILANRKAKLIKADFQQLNGWENEDYAAALNAFLVSCSQFMKLPQDKKAAEAISDKITVADFNAVCKIGKIVKNFHSKYIQVFLEKYFVPYKVEGSGDKSLFTGYYVPEIKAKTTRDNVYKFPVYSRPTDLKDGKKYYTRKQINDGALDGKGYEMFYTDDPVDLFFLHIQGSGYVNLVDLNKTIIIGYDGKNNHKFSSIGNFMLKRNLIDTSRLNVKELKKELKLYNQEFVNTILNHNESYIFFRVLKDDIVGAQGVKLTDYRSLAVDKDYIPLGFPLFVNTHLTPRHRAKLPFNRVMVAQDTGSAIRGAVRGDIFMGRGQEAEDIAFYQHAEGQYYLLLPVNVLRKIGKYRN